MTRAAMKPFIALLALVLMLAVSAGANAAIINTTDLQGRTITFDVRATAVDTDWYAAILRSVAHGDEISNVTIRIVPDQAIEGLCGDAAAACYSHAGRPTIFIPAGKNQFIEGTLIHEYGHHIDASTPVSGVPELNGIPAWWADRGMASRYASRQVAYDYSLGWDHSIAEIFAEDYAYIHVGPSYRYAITWLTPPDDALKADMFAALGGPPPAMLPAAPNTPLVVQRVGTLAPRGTKSVPFGLLGPGRRVTFTANVARATRKGVRARIQVRCNGTVAATRTIAKGQKTRTLDLPNMGPGDCDARLVSSASVSLKYTLRLQLTAPDQATGRIAS